MKRIAVLSLFALFTCVGYAAAQPTVVEIRAAEPSGPGAVLGTVTVTATPYGTLFTPNLSGLTPGIHGFHVHEHPSCAPMDRDGKPVASLGAGGHYDPAKTGKHLGPYGDGHLAVGGHSQEGQALSRPAPHGWRPAHLCRQATSRINRSRWAAAVRASAAGLRTRGPDFHTLRLSAASGCATQSGGFLNGDDACSYPCTTP